MDQFKKGLALFRDGKFKDAANTLSHARKKEPDNVKVWNALSVALSKTGNYSEALSAVDTALRLDPETRSVRKIVKRSWKNYVIPLKSMNVHISDPKNSLKRYGLKNQY